MNTEWRNRAVRRWGFAQNYIWTNCSLKAIIHTIKAIITNKKHGNAGSQNQVFMQRVHYDIFTFFLMAAVWNFYSPIDPKINPNVCVLIWRTHPQSLMLIDQSKLKLSLQKSNVWRPDADPPDHWHPQSNNQVSPCENLIITKPAIYPMISELQFTA